MSGKNLLSSLNYFRPRKNQSCQTENTADNWAQIRCGKRDWEDFYRRRWQYDKKVRSTHGVNCTGSCSWDVYVKDGIIVSELQAVDYPSCGPDFPDHEPRGCPRGATYSWYVYSPLRLKYPYVRSTLLEMWRSALKSESEAGIWQPGVSKPNPDPVAAWQTIIEDPVKRKAIQQARGKGGFVRVSHDEAVTIVAASLIYTIKKYGPDRIFGYTPIPAMSMVGYASGARFISLIGGSMLSFYDWYSDLPPASPQTWGEQTDVPESADWYESTYLIVWGTNVPMTRTPDAHFYSEARYRGARVTAVSPDYSEYTKFADTWLPAKAGTDSALAMAMTHVVLKEFYLDRQCEYFTSYAKTYTDLPFAVILEPKNDQYVSGRFLRAADLGHEVNNAEWKTVYFDSLSRGFVVPNGSIGFRWSEEGRWNLHALNSITNETVEPLLSFCTDSDGWVSVQFPFFDFEGAKLKTGAVPIKKIQVGDREVLVTTVFDLMAANLGIDRGHGGDTAKDYDDPKPYTPAWQESITGVARADAIRVAREFAENAERTRGKSMILLGSGSNHWFHSDMIYRTILNLTGLCGCQGVNGGGWAHYTGQEKVRPMAGWATLAFALDWLRPPRQQNGTSFWYFATGQWRYDPLDAKTIMSPLAPRETPNHPADYNAISARLGWLPSYPQFDRNPLDLCAEAVGKGAKTDEEIIANVVKKIKDQDLNFAIENPDSPENIPRVMFSWRANVLGASGKGHEYLLKHFLGTHNSVFGSESSIQTKEVVRKEPLDDGKLDLLVTLDFRMSTSALYSDVALPAASWYETHDLSTTDMHPFIHPLNAAIDPVWEAKTDWNQFKAIAKKFSELAEIHLGKRKDIVAVPLLHDSPEEIGQPNVRDWKKGETEPIPGKTMPSLTIVTRDYPNTHKMMTALGPLLLNKPIGAKGVMWSAAEEYEELKSKLGTVNSPGLSLGMPDLDTNLQVAEAILTLAPETNGNVAVKSWSIVEKWSGLKLRHLSAARQGEKLNFADITAQPRKVMNSPVWSGIESENRRYSAFVVNIEEKLPFRTLTGRAHFYQDHEWMLMFGDSLPLFRPPLDLKAMEAGEVGIGGGKQIVLNYLSPHSKWSIHSTYADNLEMLTLFRGGKVIWINDQDAKSIDVNDNDWLECFNVNGLVLARAIVSHRIPRGKALMYHAQERTYDTPGSPITSETGGTHNSVTRIKVKPTHMIGGYAHLSYGFNYYGPTGSQRDTVVVVRKAKEVVWYEN
jgi:nitrate reductase alpha subunit